MKLLFIFTGVVILCTNCKNNNCNLHEFKNVRERKFSLEKWHGKNLVNKNYADNEFELHNAILIQREEMLCDLTKNHLKFGKNNQKIINSLGKTSHIDINSYKLIYGNMDSTIDLSSYRKLIYAAGYNASGTCFLVLLLDKNDNYVGCLRAVSR